MKGVLMDEKNKNTVPSPRPPVMANPGTNAARADAMKEKTVKKIKTKKQKGPRTTGTGQLLATRLEGFSFSWLSWALGLMLIGAVWFALDKGGANIGGYGLSTNWMPKFTATIALMILVVMIVKISLNWRQFKKLVYLPHVIAQVSLIPIIIIIFGEVLIQSASNSGEAIWIAGVVFYALGVLMVITIMSWFIYLCVITFIIQKNPITKLDGSYLIPLSGLGFALYASDSFVNHVGVLLWVFWAVTLVLGGFGAVVLIYRYLVLGSKTSESLQNFGYISIPVALLLMGMSRILEVNHGGLSNSHQVIFLFVLFGFGCQGMVSIYILMAAKNACFIKGENNELKYSQKLSNSVLPLAAFALATACFAPVSVYTLELAQFTIVQLTFVSLLIVYTGTANTLQAFNALTDKTVFSKSTNKYLKIFI